MNKGFIFSMEAVLSLLMFSLILLSFSIPKNDSFKELIIVQQENDLLKVWCKDFPTDNEIIFDTKKLFDNASIFVDDREIIVGEKCVGERISSSAEIFDDNLNKKLIKIIVYYNC